MSVKIHMTHHYERKLETLGIDRGLLKDKSIPTEAALSYGSRGFGRLCIRAIRRVRLDRALLRICTGTEGMARGREENRVDAGMSPVSSPLLPIVRRADSRPVRLCGRHLAHGPDVARKSFYSGKYRREPEAPSLESPMRAWALPKDFTNPRPRLAVLWRRRRRFRDVAFFRPPSAMHMQPGFKYEAGYTHISCRSSATGANRSRSSPQRTVEAAPSLRPRQCQATIAAPKVPAPGS